MRRRLLCKRRKTTRLPANSGTMPKLDCCDCSIYHGQYTPVSAASEKKRRSFPEEARAEVMLLAANAERQLGHGKEAENLYKRIIAKFPKREEAKDAQYQRLINIYNSDPCRLCRRGRRILETNPSAERADQAKTVRRRKPWLLQTTESPRRPDATVRNCGPPLFAPLARGSRLQTGVVLYAVEGYAPVLWKPLPIYVQAFPTLPRRRPVPPSERWPISRTRITTSLLCGLKRHPDKISGGERA